MRQVKLFGQVFEVVEGDPGDWASNGMGRSHPKQGRILLAKDMPYEVKVHTVVHECLHTMLDMGGFGEVSNDERMVSCLTNGIISMLRDNPEVADRIGCTNGTWE